MTAAEQQISGNPAAMENAQARTTVTDQAKVQDIISRMDRAHETPMFHRIVTLVAAGMLMDSIDVYIGSAVASSTLATRWSTVAQNSTFMSAGFLGLLVGSLLAGFVGDLKGPPRGLPNQPAAVWRLHLPRRIRPEHGRAVPVPSGCRPGPRR